MVNSSRMLSRQHLAFSALLLPGVHQQERVTALSVSRKSSSTQSDPTPCMIFSIIGAVADAHLGLARCPIGCFFFQYHRWSLLATI